MQREGRKISHDWWQTRNPANPSPAWPTLARRSTTKWMGTGSIPGQGTCLGYEDSVPALSAFKRKPANVSLPLFLSPFPSLLGKKKKIPVLPVTDTLCSTSGTTPWSKSPQFWNIPAGARG